MKIKKGDILADTAIVSHGKPIRFKSGSLQYKFKCKCVCGFTSNVWESYLKKKNNKCPGKIIMENLVRESMVLLDTKFIMYFVTLREGVTTLYVRII